MRTKTLLSAVAAAALLIGSEQIAQAVQPFPEFNAAAPGSLGSINVLPAWDKATGAGKVIAIVDSGVRLSHEDLRSQLVSSGYDFVNNDNSAFDDSFDGHGTGLAGVAAAARNGVGIVGVAYNAKILPVKVRNAKRERRPDLEAKGVNYAANHGANVINLSIPGDFQQPLADAIVHATDLGVIVTMAAGNVSGGGPEFPAYLVGDSALQGRAIAVGSLKGDGKTISDFSNRAGSRQDFFLVAQGENVLTTSNASDSAYAAMGGTSFAAPQVAGAAALLEELFPNLDPETIVKILLETATDLGKPGVDEVYGHGRLNVGAAVSPQGTVDIPGSGGGGSGAGVAVAALALGGAVGYAILNKSHKLDQTLILDKYGRGYSIDLTKVTTVTDSQYDVSGVLQGLERDFNWMEMPISKDLTARLYYSTPTAALYRSMDEQERSLLADQFSDNLSNNVALELSGRLDTDLHYDLGFNLDPREQFGNTRTIHDDGAMFLSQRPFGASYLGFAGTADTLKLAYDSSESVKLSFGYNQMHSVADHGTNSRAVLFQGDWQPTKRVTLGAQLGLLREDGNLLGGSSVNAWGVDNTETVSLGVSGAYELSSHTKLVGNYSIGYSHVNAMSNGLLKDFTAIRSNSYAMGLLSHDIFRHHDAAGIAWSQPLRATSGQATLDLPVQIDAQSRIYRQSERIGLDPTGREQDVEAMYATDLGPRSRVGAHLLYQHEPQHNNQAGDAVTLLLTLQSSF